MTDYEIRGKTTLEKEISDLLRNLEEDSHNATHFGKLLKVASQYVFTNPDVTDYEDSRFKAHQLCSKCQTDRSSNESDAERERALRFRLQTCMLQCVSFRSKKNRVLERWLKGLYSTMIDCIECYKGYVRVKDEIGPMFLHVFPKESVATFLCFTEDWEEKSTLEMLGGKDLSDRQDRKPPRPTELYASLSLAGTLAARHQYEGIYKMLKMKRTQLRLGGMTEAPSGLLAFAIDEDQSTRSWAEMQTMIPVMSPEMSISKTVKKLLSQGIERKEWNGVAFILKMAPDVLKGAALLEMILAHLTQENTQASTIFQFLERMSEIKGSRLWEYQDGEYPIVILTTILDSKKYRAEALQAEASPLLFEWMKPFLKSLLSMKFNEEPNEEKEEASKASKRVFEDVFKRVIYFFLETVQLGKVDFNSRKFAFSQAISLLQYFLHIEDKFEADVTAHSAKIAAQITTFHASLLANFALRGKLPNTDDVIATGTAERQSALRLIQDIFEIDCSHLSESILEYSTITIELQTSYKKMLKISDRSQQSSALDKLFLDAAKRLDIPPWINSDLWRESYNAFRSCDDVDLFLQPLTRLSPYVQPQITSHLLHVKSSDQEKPSFQAYKERVKACLLSLTRRLRSSRGNLPQILLDVSEDYGAQASHSQSLDTMCFKSMNGVIQANLCPEPDVYKAAQNIVRSTFEDAETRGDCFRALIQCHPALALQGIKEYLESFLVAASTLVEANDAAKWMVRSFSDILDVLCSQTDGLLRIGTPHSLLDSVSASAHVRRLLPSIWQLMCSSIAIIFQLTPRWSKIVPQQDLTSWFRDVLLFASELVEQVSVVQIAAVHGGEDEPEVVAAMLKDTALPLEEASSWFRMNDLGIVQETKAYFIKGLQHFKGKVSLPSNVKERMLKFIDAQSKYGDDDENRVTLLTTRELSHLRHLLDPPSFIEIADSDEELDLVEIGGNRSDDDDDTPLIHGSVPKISAKKTSIEAPTERLSLQSNESRKAEEQRKMKQQKLSFQSLDSHVSVPFVSKPAPKPAPVPPGPRFPAATTGSNRYQSAGVSTSTSNGSSHRSFGSGALAQLRQNFTAASKWKVANRDFTRPAHLSSSRELPEPQAPGAKRTFTGAAVDASNGQSRAHPAEESDSSNSDSDEEEGDSRGIGLADMAGNKKSPIKMRSKPRIQAAPPPRRAILLEDLEAKRRQREREEAERKRKLRERANFSPLHRSILSWDFFSDTVRPPVSSNLPAVNYNHLRSTYKNAEEYVETLRPMLLLEAWSEFVGAREQLSRGGGDIVKVNATITARSAVDSFVILNATMEATKFFKANPFSESDIVYVRERQTSSTGKSLKTILAKVDMFKFDPKGHRLTLRCCLENDKQGMTSILVSGTQLEVGKMFSLVTIHREYDALQVVQYYDLIPSILQARCSSREKFSEEEVRVAQADYGVNQPQAEAIVSAFKAEQGFNLIQGPPGTGKTKTICSLVAHFIQTRKAPAVPIRAGAAGNSLGVTKKILLCAPSNAAVDEVAKRVHEGVRLKNGNIVKPAIVRLGREEAMNVSVKSFSLDALVERRLAKPSTSNSHVGGDDDVKDVDSIHRLIRELKEKKDVKRAELENARASSMNSKIIAQLSTELQSLSSTRLDLMEKLDVVKDQKQTVDRQQNADRKRTEQSILSACDVICSTLGGAGHKAIADLPFDFETVIIDEAAQAVELDTLIPLRYGCQRCILVGDPNQLPPTVLSQEAEKLNYSKSLFVRLFNNPANHVNLLSIQYRMNPGISKFPSREFYDGKLTDGPGMAALTQKPWHQDPLLAPFRFFDCRRSQEANGRGTSLINREEAQMAAAIYGRLRREAGRFGDQSVLGKVGVVTMYKEQVFELKRAFKGRFGAGIDEVVDFNTVDGFQGQEKEAIILSCVRSHGIGFLNDYRRVNVAITRAKSNLFIIGLASNLEKSGGIWPKFIDMARKEDCFMTVTTEMFQRPAAAVQAPTRPKAPVSPSPIPTNPEIQSKNQRKKARKAKRKAEEDSMAIGVEAPPAKRAHLEEQTSAAAKAQKPPINRPPPTSRVAPLRPLPTEPSAALSATLDSSAPRPSAASAATLNSGGPRPSAAPATTLNGGAARPLPPSSSQPSRSSAPSARAFQAPAPPPVRPHGYVDIPRRPPQHTNRPSQPFPRPAAKANNSVGVPILPPGPVANLPRQTTRPVQLRLPPVHRMPVFSSQQGPSEKAKSSLFMPKSNRPVRPKK
ncbi:hypothetical protein CBS101457_006129 [Exobasidium rhododendri]|nr:hypothetical protein CBS101457_006129 [Exobasidium rhododendri]